MRINNWPKIQLTIKTLATNSTDRNINRLNRLRQNQCQKEVLIIAITNPNLNLIYPKLHKPSIQEKTIDLT